MRLLIFNVLSDLKQCGNIYKNAHLTYNKYKKNRLHVIRNSLCVAILKNNRHFKEKKLTRQNGT